MSRAPRDGADPAILTPAEAEAAELRAAARKLVEKLRRGGLSKVTQNGTSYAVELGELERLLGPPQ